MSAAHKLPGALKYLKTTSYSLAGVLKMFRSSACKKRFADSYCTPSLQPRPSVSHAFFWKRAVAEHLNLMLPLGEHQVDSRERKNNYMNRINNIPFCEHPNWDILDEEMQVI